jgi:hypothetical protein
VPEDVIQQVDQSIDQTIASINQLTADPSGTSNTTTIPGDDQKIVEGTGEGTTSGPEGDKGKKGLPVCK